MTKADELTILIADDHPLFRDALCNAILNGMPGTQVVSAGDFEALENCIADNTNFDLLLLDLTMPGVSGFIGLIRLRTEYPALPIIMVSATDDPTTIRRSLELGASGFIPKSSSNEEICDAVASVMSGNVWLPANIDINNQSEDELSIILGQVATLTPQQHRVLNMIGDGMLNKQIAYSLSVSEATIKAHVSAVLLKLKVDSRTQAVIQMAKIDSATSSIPSEIM